MIRRIISIAVLIVAFVSTLALAGVSISPAVTEILLPPGTSYEGDIMVQNTGEDPIVVEAVVRGFTSPEGVPVLLDPAIDNYQFSGRDLLTITPTEQRIDPGKGVFFYYRVTMPENLAPYGGRYVAAVLSGEVAGSSRCAGGCDRPGGVPFSARFRG